ncbi:hypothetical protein CANARDRAFT_26573 [[Candida] arabinofermentans NRRL YB-2248]|uniref:GP-PDE domain-containing protein n=1 Tax=[Candida] arabinofermentans NRRL YB-2248 TaxID=983967 RepID=A0A1E4T5Y0_9ASCO|nr:hypothetical protein CANARDRAFT_26573 [[Candida] arabinofermentans NRRL YB-2248]
MKFGKTFLGHQVPEWEQHYMNYKSLKKLIKSTSMKQQELLAKDPNADTLNSPAIKGDLAAFFFNLDTNIEKVDDFYNSQYAEYDRRLKKIANVLRPNEIQFDDEEEADEVIGILLELRNCFRNLKWFGELNRRGFRKILKKLDKKVGTNRQESYLNARVYALSFSNETDIVKNLNLINEYLNKLLPENDDGSKDYTVPVDVYHDTNSSNSNIQAKQMGSSAASSISNMDMNIISSSSSSLPPPTTTFSTSNNKSSTSKPSTMDPYLEFIDKDDQEGLNQLMIKEFMSPVLAPLKLLLSLLNKSTMRLSYKCIDALLEIIPVLSDSSDISGRNFLHHHVIALGKQYVKKKEQNENSIPDDNNSLRVAHTPTEINFRLVSAFGPDGINSNDSSQGLLYIFEHLPAHLKFAILQKDNYRRTPLHYAAQYGLKEVTSIIVEFLKKWGLFNDSVSIDNVKTWGDSELLTPLHLSILGTHPRTTEVLIKAVNPDVSLTCPQLLLIATRLNSPEILSLLLSCNGIDIDYYDSETKETSLYIAAKLNMLQSLKFLLEKGADCEIGEATFGWTPIFVAAAEGFKDICDALMEANAKFDIQDQSGWTPREHAGLRGHLDICKLLTPKDFNPYELLEANNALSPHLSPQIKPYNNLELATSVDRLSDYSDSSNGGKNSSARNHSVLKHLKHQRSTSPAAKPVKSFGHRYLKQNESLILITLGTTDIRDQTPAIDLKRVPLSKAHSTELDTALSVVISVKNLDQPSVLLDLPLDDNHGGATDPISFKCVDRNPLDTVIYFDIVPTYQYGDEKKKEAKILGRAVTILRNAYTKVGPNLRSLSSSISLPILECDTLEVLGTIKFEFMLITPFSHPKMTLDRTETYWKSLVSSRVIGHRGNGMNSRTRKSLQLGENTVESFIAAASLGASYVEFDVQLTKDDIPVVYHDFLVAESGIDVPMHALTLEQFMGLNQSTEKLDKNKKQSLDDFHLYSKNRFRSSSYNSDLMSLSRIQNSVKEYGNSVGGSGNDIEHHDDDDHDSGPQQERMKLTKTWKTKHYKGNSRGSSIASSFVTLVELFKKVPKTVGFNIECKYPMLDEAEQEDMGQIAPDMNHWVDTVLKIVYENADGRDIIFSSFHPDICVLLSLKQPSIPILFLTEAGTAPMADVRANSLQAGIRFAKKWNLLGIVSAADTIVACPRLASVVKASGLVCVTYGVPNNDPEIAKLEMAAGVDAVIVDSVLAVRKELTKEVRKDEDSLYIPRR